MRLKAIVSTLLIVFSFHSGPALAGEHPHHDLQVALEPAEQYLSATDRITFPSGIPETIEFRLHSDLHPMAVTEGAAIEKIETEGFITTYRVQAPAGPRDIAIRYEGRIFHELDAATEAYARGIRQTQGQISETGAYLSGGSFWYPDFDHEFLTFHLQVELPEGWMAVSQGSPERMAAGTSAWAIDKPQEQVFLIAGRFTQYTRPAGPATAMVFLREPDPALAERYLKATEQYLTMYEKLIGPYPYAKFAVVENFWETGFGMPSFTLLGPRVIRFPFILRSSYPHEILHNWWGNSVYPVYRSGNWAEGLTAYLSDHLIKAQQGEAADYRQTVLQKYTDYVSTEKDFPLTAFTSRHSSATEAVGYGKATMFFHMLRRNLGDSAFKQGLQAFYQRHRFAYAGFDDLQAAFESVAGRPLAAEFDQWVARTGAPQLVVKTTEMREDKGRFLLDVTLMQQQEGAPYQLTVPAAVSLAAEPKAREIDFVMNQREQQFRLAFSRRPLRIDIDPQYDVFRKLGRAEIPPALSQIFGQEKIVAVLPDNVSEKRQSAYRNFATSLGRAGPKEVQIVFDRDLEKLPEGDSVILLGWENRFIDEISGTLDRYDSDIAPASTTLAGQTISRPGTSVVITTRHPASPDRALAWVAADPLEALPGLARKLPHYHKYSYLAFEGKAPENIVKGRWPVLDSPMTVFFDAQRPEMGKLRVQPPLAELPPVASE